MKILTAAGLALWGASVVPGSEIARVFGNGRIQRSDRTARVTTAAEIAAVAIAVVEATSLSETKGWGRKPHPIH